VNRRGSAAGAPRTLALQLVDTLAERIRSGQIAPGRQLPTESALMSEQGVSRTVVREALSQLQASGLVETRHGIGTFVLDAADAASFSIRPRQMATLQDVVAVLELRIGVETEAAGLAAQRRSERNLVVMRAALDAFEQAVARGDDAVAADFRFHAEIARATQNTHFSGLLGTLGARIIPRARVPLTAAPGYDEERQAYLRRVNTEHESIFDAIERHDADGARAAMRTHLSNSRERRRREHAARIPGNRPGKVIR
jgi:GntR family transcriptional regulator, transcriptional repressor for pyruvate dehydrogenase complex